MKCPFCGLDHDKVIDSRASEEGFVIRRRRHCLSCQRRFTTFERVAELNVYVIKKNQFREPFNTAKIRDGLKRACWKRPVTDEQIESLISKIEQQVYREYDAEISSRELGGIVIEQLRNLDEVAYIRFASVYREFDDIHDFVEELRPMLGQSIDRRFANVARSSDDD
ncbi:MAG TPA: transcriptional regulator NrdR [Pirellulaceae bacterium]|nr:transcriptional regulator NrdR [Pirellulaceae bacterium]HMO90933.1 transcriptional regulator NrdR [Pirellulaceae bacterium]HMP69832.1 transcriptional regulator NrdR [Pirellulaceae bacterium]